MKKFLLLIAFALVALVGCKSEDKYPLDGTVWKGTFKVEQTATATMTISFYETTFKVDGELVETGTPIIESAQGTYLYNHPKVTMTVEGEIIEATITDNKLMLDGVIFTRQ